MGALRAPGLRAPGASGRGPRMKIALVKPSWRIRGGFEVVVDRVEGELVAAGHAVSRVELDVTALPRTPFGISVDDAVWARSPEWFSHLAMLDAFRAVDVADAEARDLAGVSHFLAGSTRVVERLRRYQGADVPVSLYESPAPAVADLDTTTYDHVLTVSRHEFTKRTE